MNADAKTVLLVMAGVVGTGLLFRYAADKVGLLAKAQDGFKFEIF